MIIYFKYYAKLHSIMAVYVFIDYKKNQETLIRAHLFQMYKNYYINYRLLHTNDIQSYVQYIEVYKV